MAAAKEEDRVVFVVFEEYRSGGGTSVHRAACPNFARRDTETALGRWFGPFSTLADAKTLARQLADYASATVRDGVECCGGPASDAPALSFRAPADAGQIRLKRVCLTSLIASLSISALAGIFVLLFGEFGSFEGKVLGTTLVIGAYSLSGLCGAIWYDRRRYLPLAAATIIASAGGLLYALACIWDVLRDTQDTWKLLGIQVTWTAFLTHTSLNLLSLSEDRRVRGIVTTTVSCAALIAAILTAIILDEPKSGDWIPRVLGTLSIVAVLGTIVAPLARRMTSLPEA